MVVTVSEHLLRAIADPNIALLLVVLGAFGIYAEFCSPGLVAPGVLGALFLFFGVTALSRLPISRTGVSIMIVGVAFCILEARWLTRGALSACGALVLTLGAVNLIASPGSHIRWSTAVVLAIPFALVTSFLLTVGIRAHRNKVVSD